MLGPCFLGQGAQLALPTSPLYIHGSQQDSIPLRAGKSVIRLRQLDVVLHLPEPGARLPLRPLLPASQAPQGLSNGPAAPGEAQAGAGTLGTGGVAAGEASGLGSRGPVGSGGSGLTEDEITIPAVLSLEVLPDAGSATLGSNAAGQQDPCYAPYRRARLQSWLGSLEGSRPAAAMAGVSTAGTTAQSSAAGAAAAAAAAATGEDDGGSLGAGPCSMLDVSLAGFELCLPHDREPGPCQRYAEMYFKALQLVGPPSFSLAFPLLLCVPRVAAACPCWAGEGAAKARRRGWRTACCQDLQWQPPFCARPLSIYAAGDSRRVRRLLAHWTSCLCARVLAPL